MSRAARDAAVVGGVTFAALVGLLIWSGGSADTGDVATPGATPSAATVPPDFAQSGPALSPAPGVVDAQAAALAAVPAPPGGTETAGLTGMRVWSVPATTTAALATAYRDALTAAGWAPQQYVETVPGFGSMPILDPAGVPLTAMFTQMGADASVTVAP